MSDDNNVFKLSDGSSIVKKANGKIKAHIPSKKSPGSLLLFPSRVKGSAKANSEPEISYEDARSKYQSTLETKREESNSIFIVEEDFGREMVISPLFVNHDLIIKDYNQSVAYNRVPSGIIADIEGEPLGILLRFEDEAFVETTYAGEKILVAQLEVEPWVPNIDRGRGIEYRFIIQELEKPSIVNTGQLDFFDVKVSVPEDNTAFAVELIRDGWEIGNTHKNENFNIFEKRIPVLQ